MCMRVYTYARSDGGCILRSHGNNIAVLLLLHRGSVRINARILRAENAETRHRFPPDCYPTYFLPFFTISKRFPTFRGIIFNDKTFLLVRSVTIIASRCEIPRSKAMLTALTSCLLSS